MSISNTLTTTAAMEALRLKYMLQIQSVSLMEQENLRLTVGMPHLHGIILHAIPASALHPVVQAWILSPLISAPMEYLWK